ncbi:hypothetical protein [Morganella morganii]|uniref:hypothetical protein n=1 Tax=Morganella morganii TaxID=582 RepID=UPI000788979D|nr:hypothetical protein [Morganella morganii]EKV4234804.1 hypothetical protein [Morganella morganii]ELL8927927.1 hypothetical protein [Morganella morganii]ELY4880513.1 hypothetical protein [Morganella morganii]MBS9569581.1 hypothetical protein [Morganella morganii subsp. morganii]MBT0496221.1 hypothetical protein [Morganella morganii subsp. morganii]
MKKIAVIIPFVLLLSACATKQYPQAAAVSGEESALMNCHDIKTEIAKTRSIQQDIEKTGEFDGKTILGFLGDFGIGNGIAKGDAREKVSARLGQLMRLQENNCR